MKSAQDPYASMRSAFYRREARQLLHLSSIEEIERFLSTAEGLDFSLLVQALTEARDEAANAGKSASTRLADFVLEVVTTFLQKRNSTPARPSVINSPESLLQAAAVAPSALHAVRLLQQYRHLLSARLIQDHQIQVVDQMRHARGNPPSTAVRILLCFVVAAKLIRDREVLANCSMLWASYARDQGRSHAALRRFLTVETVAAHSGNTFLRLGALAGSASVYDQMGDTRRAADAYAAALEIAKSSPDCQGAIPGTRMKLAICLHRMNRYSDALQLIDSALAASDSLSSDPETQLNIELRCRLIRGLLLEDLGRFDEGRSEHQQAARLAAASGDRSREFEALTNLAASYSKVGETRKAIQSFQQLLKTTREWGNLAMVASTDNNLGSMLLELDRAAEALPHFFAALNTKLLTDSKGGEVISYIGIIDAFRKLGQSEKAKTFETLCLVPILESGDVGSIQLYASRVLGDKADPADAEQAVSLVKWAQEKARAQGELRDDLLLSEVIGRWYGRHGRPEEALEVFRRAIKAGLAADPDSPVVLRLQVDLAEQLSTVRKTSQEAYDLLAPIVAKIERQVREIFLDQRRGEMISEWIRLYGALIRLLIQPDCGLLVRGDQRSPTALAFDLHESAKARSFVSSLAAADLPVPDSVPRELRDEETLLLKREREYQAEHQRERIERESVRLDRLRQIAADLDACWQKMESYAPAYVKLRRAESARVEDVCAVLRDGAASVATALVSAFIDQRGLVWFVQRSDSHVVQIFRSPLDITALLAAAKELRRAFNGAPLEFPPYPPIRRNEPHKRSLEFFEKLSGDLLSFLPGIIGVEHICIAPHGPLHLLPLHALRTDGGHHLAEEFAVTYIPSLSSLRYCMARRLQSDAHVSGGSVYCAGVASREDARPDLLEHDHTIFGGSGFANIVVESGLSAERNTVLQSLCGPTVIHLTCHGFFDQTNPLNSGLLLSNGRERPPRNAWQIPFLERSAFILSAGDLLRTPMNAELVTLRACSTGLQAERNSGDEFDGFSRTLLQAGNAAALVSLWNVDQESSHRFLARFYQNWSNPVSPVEKWRALWLTQKEFLGDTAEPFLRHPYHWAPFVLIGDWR